MDRVRWAEALRAVAQSGLTYATDSFDQERYETVRQVAAEIAGSVTGEDPVALEARFADETGHATPKVDVRGVVVDPDDRILLVRETGWAGWNFPGGWAEVGQTPAEAVAKEVYEEAGLVVRPIRLLGVYSRDLRSRPRWPVHVYNIYVHCAPEPGRPTPDGEETQDAGFFDIGELPELSPKTEMQRLLRTIELARNPQLPSDLD